MGDIFPAIIVALSTLYQLKKLLELGLQGSAAHTRKHSSVVRVVPRDWRFSHLEMKRADHSYQLGHSSRHLQTFTSAFRIWSVLIFPFAEPLRANIRENQKESRIGL